MQKSKRLTTDVLAVLSSLEVDGNTVRIVGQLDRPMYVRVNEALEALGGKWNRKAKAHLFSDDPAERIDAACLTQSVDLPKDFEFYATPAALAARMVEWAQPKNYEFVIEPSAGQGALVDAVLEEAPFANVFAVELMPRNVEALRARYAGDMNVKVYEADFLTLDPDPNRSCAILNPPFSKRQDVRHIMRAFEWLAPGGRLISVASAGVSFRQDKLTVSFREFVESHDGTIEPLPAGTFAAAGTSVNTVLVTVRK